MHKSYDELQVQLEDVRNFVVEGGTYRHFKGSSYVLNSLGIWEPTEETVVIYQADDMPDVNFVRPASDFLDVVRNGDVSVNRFRLT